MISKKFLDEAVKSGLQTALKELPFQAMCGRMSVGDTTKNICIQEIILSEEYCIHFAMTHFYQFSFEN